jgi:hypothetical protein
MFKDMPQSEIQIHHCDAPIPVFTGNTTGRETHVLASEKLWAPEGKGPLPGSCNIRKTTPFLREITRPNGRFTTVQVTFRAS